MYREKRRVMAKKIIWDLATVSSCIDLSVMIVKKSPTVGPLLILYSPLWMRTMQRFSRKKNNMCP
jgi:hypothetical protein